MRQYLLVDDNVALAENLAEIIREFGDEAIVAGSGTEALAFAREQHFDALITDMKMPGMTGAELVQRVREIDPGLPAIVITAYTGAEDLSAAEMAGVLGILPKPIPIDRLLALMGQARRNGLVVIIEDDPAFADNLAELLRDAGFSTVTATTVIETDQIGPVAPFAALVDVRVAGGPDGEALRRLEMRFPRLPTLVITGCTDLPGIQNPVYRKPFDSSVVLKHVQDLYSRARAA